MIFGKPGKATKLKKAVYLLASTTLGILLSFIAHAAIEINYLRLVASRGEVISFYGGCVLSPLLQVSLLALGILGGLWLGRFWWRKLYVERVWVKRFTPLDK